MIVAGQEIGLAYTVRASIELGKLNGGHSMQEFFDSMDSGDDEKDCETIISAVKILHDAYERQKTAEEAKEGRIYKPVEIDTEAFYDLKMSEWQSIAKDVITVIQKDSGIEIETVPDKKAKKKETA